MIYYAQTSVCLRAEAERVVVAKARVERMILGEEKAV
jgi:hypothetical protein